MEDSSTSASGTMLMTFGKFKGWAVSELPTRYLERFYEMFTDLRGPLRGAIRQEIQRRRADAQHEAQRTVKKFRVPILPDGRLGHFEFVGEA